MKFLKYFLCTYPFELVTISQTHTSPGTKLSWTLPVLGSGPHL